ncbi:MAG TPA: efflux RND transporter permease subunit [Steroidobacteraceae bacterium]|nr:efflux RND transporter permease subunit [Steroidobacteraceae bacterium]
MSGDAGRHDPGQGPAHHEAAGFNLSAWALRHKPLVGFMMVVMLLAGFRAYDDLGRDEDPPFTIKTMVVRALWPGADANQTAKQLTDRLEKPLESLQYLDFVTSYTKPGEATIMVNLRDNTPPSAVPDQWYQVRKKLGDIRGQLPQGAIGPFFNDDFGDVYGVIYALTSDGFTYRELRDQAEYIRAELLRVPNVGKVDLIGVQDEVIYIDFSLRQMAGLGIDPDLVAATLASQNAVIASGTIETPGERIMVRVSGALDSVEKIENVAIRVGDRQVRLRDFARVTRGYKDPPSPQYRYNAEPAIGIGVSMAKGGNVLALGTSLEKELKRIESDLPVGIDVHRVANQPEVVEESVGHFTRGLFEAIGIVLIVSLISLGLRAGLVVAISIPLVLAIVFVFMQGFEISLQRISLGALIISLGLLVDDAMIAVEMMVKKMEEGWDKFRAATFAYTSTAFPMLTGTLVSVAGFLPVGFAKSSAGEYCFTLFAVVAIALLVSWVVAVIFTPYIGVAILKEQPAHEGAHHEVDSPMAARFRKLLLQALANRGWVILGTAGAFVVAVILFGFVQQQFFPSSERPELVIDLRLQQNSSIYATQAQVEKLEKVLLADPDIVYHSFYVGSGAVRFYLPLNQQLENANFAQAIVLTKSYDVRDQVKKRLEKVLREDFDTLMTRVDPLSLGPPVDWPLQYRVSGPDVAGVRAIAESVAATMRANTNTRVVNFDWNEMTKSMRIAVDQEKARQLGISSEQVSKALSSALSGRTVTQFRDDIYLIDVQGRAEARDRGDLGRLRDLEIGIQGGNSVPLTQIATFEYGLEETIIWRRNRLPTITVQSKIAEGLQPATVNAQLDEPIEALVKKLPPGYRIEVGGAAGESAKGSASIMAVIPVMFLLMLFILMLQLHSTQKLLLVMLTAPLAIIGVTLALLLFNRPFGFVAMLGVFALVGMIIRNSVVLMAQIKENEDAGMARHAAIVDATMHRLRPILLTAAAAILGLIPIVREVFWGPMAVAMMGGLFIATVLTLIFLPALYASWYRVPRQPAGS